jgi:phosphatidylethanolamine-binding protein
VFIANFEILSKMHIHLRAAVFASLVTSALSNGHEAVSVSVADFKSSFTSAEIVPDVLAAFSPSLSFYAGYTSADGDGAMLMPGTVLTTAEAKAPFEMSVENIASTANVTSSTRFIVYMVLTSKPLFPRACI